jgi:hypothetical protein
MLKRRDAKFGDPQIVFHFSAQVEAIWPIALGVGVRSGRETLMKMPLWH